VAGERRLTFVVRSQGQWALTPIPATDPVDLDIDGLVAELHASAVRDGGPVADPTPPRVHDLGPDADVAATWMLVGEITGGRFVVATADGGNAGLDEADLRFLDTVTSWTTLRELAATTGADLDDLRHRGARLVVVGCLRGPMPPPLEDEVAEVEAVDEPVHEAEPSPPPAPSRWKRWTTRRPRP
jgi:hypothetical protein